MRPEVKQALRRNKTAFIKLCKTYFSMTDCESNKAYDKMKQSKYLSLNCLIGTQEYEAIKEALKSEN